MDGHFGGNMTTPKTPVLDWRNFSDRGETVAHVVVHHLPPGFVQMMHAHSFAEVFWCRSGGCSHRVNRQDMRFSEGDLVMIRPSDTHELRTEPNEECVYSLVSFPKAVYARMRKLYASEDPGFWGGHEAMPRCMTLTAMQQEWFDGAFRGLLREPQNQLALDRFLLNLVYELRQAASDPFSACPAWLQKALRELRKPENIADGARALERLTGRSREHIARVLRRSSGLATSVAVNRARVEYAAGRLVLTRDTVLRIALDAGYAALGHFYLQFQKRFGMPPNQYRREHSTLDRSA